MALIKYSRLIHQIILLLDIVLTGLAFIAAVHVRDFLLPIIPSAGAITIQNYYFHIALICLVWLIILSFQDGYSKQRFLFKQGDYANCQDALVGIFDCIRARISLERNESAAYFACVVFIYQFCFFSCRKSNFA